MGCSRMTLNEEPALCTLVCSSVKWEGKQCLPFRVQDLMRGCRWVITELYQRSIMLTRQRIEPGGLCLTQTDRS